MSAAKVCSAPASGCLISTGIGLSADLSSADLGSADLGSADLGIAEAAEGAIAFGRSISWLSFYKTSDARSSVPVPAATPRKL